MKKTVILSVISLLGTMIGTIGGIMATARLTNYRIYQKKLVKILKEV